MSGLGELCHPHLHCAPQFRRPPWWRWMHGSEFMVYLAPSVRVRLAFLSSYCLLIEDNVIGILLTWLRARSHASIRHMTNVTSFFSAVEFSPVQVVFRQYDNVVTQYRGMKSTSVNFEVDDEDLTNTTSRDSSWKPVHAYISAHGEPVWPLLANSCSRVTELITRLLRAALLYKHLLGTGAVWELEDTHTCTHTCQQLN